MIGEEYMLKGKGKQEQVNNNGYIRPVDDRPDIGSGYNLQ